MHNDIACDWSEHCDGLKALLARCRDAITREMDSRDKFYLVKEIDTLLGRNEMKQIYSTVAAAKQHDALVKAGADPDQILALAAAGLSWSAIWQIFSLVVENGNMVWDIVTKLLAAFKTGNLSNAIAALMLAWPNAKALIEQILVILGWTAPVIVP